MTTIVATLLLKEQLLQCDYNTNATFDIPSMELYIVPRALSCT